MFEQVKQEIDNKIKTNGNNEITANRLNGVLQDMMDSLAEVIEDVQRSIGDQVEANPEGEATETMTKLKIGETIYEIPEGIPTDMNFEQKLQTQANINNQESSEAGRLGYVVLQPEDDKDLEHTSFAAQIADKPNTIYEVRDVFDINNGSVILPANCVLKFNGGIVKNGSIDFNGSYIDGDKPQLLNIEPSGMVANDKLQPQVFGAKGDGVSDDTKAIRNALKVCNNVYIPKGNYKIRQYWCSGYPGRYAVEQGGDLENAIVIARDNTTLTLDDEATLIAGWIENEIECARRNNFTAVIWILGDNVSEGSFTTIKNVKVEGGKIIGNRPMFTDADYDTDNGGYLRENYSGIVCEYVENLTIKNIKISDNSGDSIYLVGGYNCTIKECEMARDRRNAVAVGVVDGLTISDCYIHDERKENVTYPNGNTNSGIIRNACQVISVEPEPSPLVALLVQDTEKNITIKNNLVDLGEHSILFIGRCENLFIVKNKLINVNSPGAIRLSTTGSSNSCKLKNFTIANNVIEGVRQESYSSTNIDAIGIYVNSEGINKILNNSVKNFGFVAIDVVTSTLVIEGNDCEWNHFILYSQNPANTSPQNIDEVNILVRGNTVKCDTFFTVTKTHADALLGNVIEMSDNNIGILSSPTDNIRNIHIPPFAKASITNNNVVDYARNLFSISDLVVASCNISIDSNRFDCSKASVGNFRLNYSQNIFNGELTNNILTFPRNIALTVPVGFTGLFVFYNNVFNDNKEVELVPVVDSHVVNSNNVYAKNGSGVLSVTRTLTNVTIDNLSDSIAFGGLYIAELTAESGYTIGSVTILMKGIDITSFAYDVTSGIIYIPVVNGNLTITATAS